MKNLILLFLFVSNIQFLIAQKPHHCGTDESPIVERLLRNKARLQDQSIQLRQSTYYIPVAMHLFGDDDGSHRISDQEALNQLCLLNEAFGEDYYFYLKEPLMHFNNTVLNNDFGNHIHSLHVENMLRDSAVNIFFVEDIDNDDWGHFLAVSTDQLIVVSNSVAQDRDNNYYYIAHEVGHYFNLLHTHYNWYETNAFTEENYPGIWPVVPDTTPFGLPTEYQDGTNCNLSGDYICDTPPDYGFIWDWTNDEDCRYTVGAQDPSGTPVDPPENNMMGYYSCDSYVFTTGQHEVMKADLDSPEKAYLRRNITPTGIGQLGDIELLSPTESGGTVSGQNVHFDWEDLPEAYGYFLEVASNPFFQLSEIFYAEESEYTVDHLPSGKKMHWRVIAFNALGCQKESEEEAFETDASTGVKNTVSNDFGLQISPNPAQSSINLEFEIPIIGAGTFTLYDLAGKKLKSFVIEKGQQKAHFDLTNITPGLYFYEIEVEKSSVKMGKLIVEGF